MTPLGALRVVWRDLTALFSAPKSRLWFLLLVASVAQVGFWYIATPGPTLLRFAPRGLPTAVNAVLWSLVFLVLVPGVLMGIFGIRLRDVGVRLGDTRYGFPATLATIVIALPLIYLSTADASLQQTYPWAGAWVGRSLLTLLAWVVIYGLYYFAFEFFYRGFLLHVVRGAWGVNAGLWVQTLAAGLVHLGKPLPEALAAVPASLVFGVMAVRGRSILYPMLLHLAIGVATDLFVLGRLGLLLPR